MLFQEDVIQHVANRTAALLGEWLGLSPLAKSDNGDRTCGLGMALLALAQSDAPAPAPNVVEQMTEHIGLDIRRRLMTWQEGTSLFFDTDYGPGRKICDLSAACGIQSSWPIKSSIRVQMYETGITICDSRGYGSEGLTHHYVESCGWLVSPARIDRRILPIVLKAIETGEVNVKIARLDPFNK